MVFAERQIGIHSQTYTALLWSAILDRTKYIFAEQVTVLCAQC